MKTPRQIALEIANEERGEFMAESTVAHHCWLNRTILADLIEQGIKSALEDAATAIRQQRGRRSRSE